MSSGSADLAYLSGFGNEHATEAVPGALPRGQNSPQRAPFGLYAEQLSGTAFTAPRRENRRSWLYRIRPTASHPAYEPLARPSLVRGGPFDEVPPTPNRLRWSPPEPPTAPTDFVDDDQHADVPVAHPARRLHERLVTRRHHHVFRAQFSRGHATSLDGADAQALMISLRKTFGVATARSVSSSASGATRARPVPA